MEKYLKNLLCRFCGNKYQIESYYSGEINTSIGCDLCCIADNAPSGTKVVYGGYDRSHPERADELLERNKTYTIDRILHGHNWIEVELVETGRRAIFDYYLFTPADFDLSHRVCAIKDDEVKIIEKEE